MARGFVPAADIVRDPDMLYIAIGILGATVMPHNLYLHSSIVQTRRYEETSGGQARGRALRVHRLDDRADAGAVHQRRHPDRGGGDVPYRTGNTQVAEIQDAYQLLTPLLGVPAREPVFALALLASGQNSTLTGTLAGPDRDGGFLNIRLRPWLRRLITRGMAIVPAAIVAILYGESGTAQLLILSQVILSLQLSFAVFPLVAFTSDRAKMGAFVNPAWLKALAYAMAVAHRGPQRLAARADGRG